MLLVRTSSCVALVCAAVSIATPTVVSAQESGSVQIPLSAFLQLSSEGDSGPPTRYAMSNANVGVDVAHADGRATATVAVQMQVRVHGQGWTLVPLMPTGVAVTAATVDGTPVELVPTATGLAWATEGPGTHTVQMSYRVDAVLRSDGGSIALPLPASPSSTVVATLPGVGLDAVLLPAATTTTRAQGVSTILEATVPAGAGAQLSWRTAGLGNYTVSRAVYRGEIIGQAIRLVAEFGIELPTDAAATVPLLPTSVALSSLVVDRTDAAIAISDSRYAVALRGRGRHVVSAVFEVPLVTDDGLPGVELAIPEVPVSRFELTLPGDKDVQVTPSAGVRIRRERGTTIASFNAAMTDSLSIRWPEAIPDDAGEHEDRANAELHHVVHAEEGVLHVRAITTFDVTHGTRSQLELDVPAGVQVNGVTAEAGGVSDWRVSDARVLTVFLDRQLEGELTFEVAYEQPLEMQEGVADVFAVPLLAARDAHRQRGMVALLASRELTISPRQERNLNRLGENQLPASVRDSIDMTVAHTYRYVEATPELSAVTARRERVQGRFDAQIDTLFSLEDVTTTAEATVDIHVKSGGLLALEMVLPEGVNFLGLSAPSLREHHINTVDGEQVLSVEFTQDMEGQFRVEVRYERIAGDNDRDELAVPTLHVRGSDVEQGRIAVEALAAVQVDPAVTERLSPLDVSELPQQLVLRTTNPILLAYKYVQASPPPVLGLRITRHAEIATQDATIDEAHYQTLYTRDGFVVTIARFMVRNQRKQFLRVHLPEGSEVWSARVDGQSETPALEAGDADAPTVLINIINSAQGFPVELVYATRSAGIGVFGRVRGALPTMDMVVTRTTWQVYLPTGADYATPSTDMTLIESGAYVHEVPALDDESPDGLRVHVPTEGVRFTFQKLYAGQGDDGEVGFSIPYAGSWGSTLSTALSLLGTMLVWLAFLGFIAVRFHVTPIVREAGFGLALATYRDSDEGRPAVAFSRGVIPALAAIAVGGIVLLALTLGYLATSPTGAIIISVVLGVAAIAMLLRERAGRWLTSIRARLDRPAAAGAGNGETATQPSAATSSSKQPDAVEIVPAEGGSATTGPSEPGTDDTSP